MLLDIFLSLLILGGTFFTLLGMLVAFHVIRKQRWPADRSNRINKIRLIWFALKHEGRFTDLFPWLMNDESENV